MQISHSKETGIGRTDLNNIEKERGSLKRNHSTQIFFLILWGQRWLFILTIIHHIHSKYKTCYAKNKIYILSTIKENVYVKRTLAILQIRKFLKSNRKQDKQKKVQMKVTITAKSPITTVTPCWSHLLKVTELLFKLGIVLGNKTKHNFTE